MGFEVHFQQNTTSWLEVEGGSNHQVIKLLTATWGLQLFAVIFHFADWIIFTETGEHEIFFPIIASLCEILASTVFLLLLLVLAQGWTVSRFEVMYPKLLLASCVTTAVLSVSC